MMTMDIAPLADSDIPAVLALWQRCGLTHSDNDPRADIERARRSGSAAVLVGREAGAVVASVMVGFDGHRGWVYYLAVEPARQRAGRGAAMLRAAEDWLRGRFAPKVLLMVSEAHRPALGFYARHGFAPSPMVTLVKRLD